MVQQKRFHVLFRQALLQADEVARLILDVLGFINFFQIVRGFFCGEADFFCGACGFAFTGELGLFQVEHFARQGGLA